MSADTTRILHIINILITWIFVIPLILLSTGVRGQSKARIENVDFQVKNDTLYVSYDLANARHNERFTVSLKVIPEQGENLVPVSVSGDVGKDITGGKGNMIIWALTSDNVALHENIAVEIEAIPQITEIKYVTLGKALLLSAIVPGLGVNKLQGGGAWWLMSVAVYGCIGGSVVYNNLAQDNYRNYELSMETGERDRLYSTVKSQESISTGLMYAAGAIWIGNMIWTLATPNKTIGNGKGVTALPVYDPITHTQGIRLKIGF